MFAIQSVTFGQGNNGEWKSVGFDLDGKTSTDTSTDLCQPAYGGSAAVAYPDGDNGIDNSFGKNVLPILLAANPSWVNDANSHITNGDGTVLMKLMCLPPTGDVPVLVSEAFAATPLGTTPQWLGTDAWPVDPEFLSDPTDAGSSMFVFANGSVSGSTFHAGPGGTLVFSIPVQTANASTQVQMTIHDAHVTWTFGANRTSATAGVIGGVLDTKEFVVEVGKVGAVMGLCGSSLLNTIINQVRQASDIMVDGSQDPGMTCNGISIGIGFEMQAATIAGVGPGIDAGSPCP